MRTLDAQEAEDQFLELLDEVAKGETVVITKDGQPVARLEPIPSSQQISAAQAMEERERYRTEHNIRLNGLSIKEMIEEGRM